MRKPLNKLKANQSLSFSLNLNTTYQRVNNQENKWKRNGKLLEFLLDLPLKKVFLFRYFLIFSLKHSSNQETIESVNCSGNPLIISANNLSLVLKVILDFFGNMYKKVYISYWHRYSSLFNILHATCRK